MNSTKIYHVYDKMHFIHVCHLLILLRIATGKLRKNKQSPLRKSVLIRRLMPGEERPGEGTAAAGTSSD